MKAAHLLIAMCIIGTSAFAQETANTTLANESTPNTTTSRFSLSISTGVAVPLGDYGATVLPTETTIANEHVGLAKTGYQVDLTAGYLFTDNCSAVLYVGGSMNSFNTAAFEIVPMGHGGFCGGGPANPNTTPIAPTPVITGVTAKNYYPVQYLAGPAYSINASKKFKLDLRLLAGMVTINMPTVTESLSDGTIKTITGNEGKGFGCQFGMCINYSLTHKISLIANMAYTGASIIYPGYTASGYSEGAVLFAADNSSKQTMITGLITATVGAAFHL